MTVTFATMAFKNNFLSIFTIFAICIIGFCTNEEIDGWDIDYTIRYTKGKRLAGDRVVLKSSYHRNQTEPFTMTYNFAYNEVNGATVTYAELYARQSSPRGTIRILKGGIGDTEIHLAVATFDVTYFDLEYYIYGRY